MMILRLKRRQKDGGWSEGRNENKEADTLQVSFWTEHRTFIFYLHTHIHVGLPWRLYGKESAHSARAPDSIPGKTSWRREWQPTPVFLPGEFHGQRNLAGRSPWGCKELDTTEWLTHTHTHAHSHTHIHVYPHGIIFITSFTQSNS